MATDIGFVKNAINGLLWVKLNYQTNLQLQSQARVTNLIYIYINQYIKECLFWNANAGRTSTIERLKLSSWTH